MTTKFYRCRICGNIIIKVVDGGATPVCCGEEMKELQPNVTDGAGEKHLPVIEKIEDCKIRVKVGSEPHPMMDEHHIVFIYVETFHGGILKYLKTDAPAEATFCVKKEDVVAVYEYCNIHGLWKTTVCETRKCSSK